LNKLEMEETMLDDLRNTYDDLRQRIDELRRFL
jgi:hypothetical protein